MRPTISFPSSLGSRDSRQLILVHVTNLYDLVVAYGTAFYHDAAVSIKTRLETLGSPKSAVLLGSPYIFIDLEACHGFDFYSRDALCQHVNALLTFEPVMCTEKAAFLRTETSFIEPNDREFHLTNGYQSTSLKNKLGASLTHLEDRKERYRADMALAVDLFSQPAANTLVLAFQPIVSLKDRSIYWEAVPRRSEDSPSSGFSACMTHIAALERLGLVGRFDQRILWTVFDLLIKQPGIKMGCNISAHSLKFDCWWRLIFDALQTKPAVASRLTIGIAEPGSIAQDDEAITLLQTLRVLGCKVAIDDTGAGYSTLDSLFAQAPILSKSTRLTCARSVAKGRSPHKAFCEILPSFALTWALVSLPKESSLNKTALTP